MNRWATAYVPASHSVGERLTIATTCAPALVQRVPASIVEDAQLAEKAHGLQATMYAGLPEAHLRLTLTLA